MSSKFLKENNLHGNLLVDFDWGEYCIWKLYPQFKVSIDGRYKTVYPESFIDEYFQFLYGNDDWELFLKKYPHQWALLRKDRPAARLPVALPDN